MSNLNKTNFEERKIPVPQYDGVIKMIPASVIPVLAKALEIQDTTKVGEIIDKYSMGTDAYGVLNFSRIKLLNALKTATEKGNNVSIHFCQGGIGAIINGESSFFDANAKIG